MTPRAAIADHLLALLLAAAACCVIAPWRSTRDPLADAKAAPVPSSKLSWPLQGHVPNYSGEPYLASLLHRSLAEGSSIVLFGSSELNTGPHPNKPTTFFPEELHVPLLAVGHAGNQSLSIHAQLIAADTPLDKARLAILVSPGWFSGKPAREGTALEAFLEYQPSPSFYRVQNRLERGDTLARAYTDYLLDHERELSVAQPIVQLMTREADAGARSLHWFSQPWTRYEAGLSAAVMLAEPQLPGRSDAPWNMPQWTPDQWAERYRNAIADHLKQCTNNAVFVNDDYYAQYVNGDTKEVKPVPVDEDRELRDFASLLDFLTTTRAKPFFVLQPLNPYVYTNVRTLTPTMEAVRAALDAHGFPYLDMWVDDTARYVPGTLTDVMHLGPLGWCRIDSALTTRFR